MLFVIISYGNLHKMLPIPFLLKICFLKKFWKYKNSFSKSNSNYTAYFFFHYSYLLASSLPTSTQSFLTASSAIYLCISEWTIFTPVSLFHFRNISLIWNLHNPLALNTSNTHHQFGVKLMFSVSIATMQKLYIVVPL